MQKLTVTEGGERLDVYVAEQTELTRSYIKQLLSKGNILLNGEQVKSGKIVKIGDEISIDIPITITELVPQDIAVEFLYEDDDIIVVNKPQGLTVHPSGGSYKDTLVNALLFKVKNLSGINGVIRPGIVHRLDKDTSGVMVVAKNDTAHLSLSSQIERREVDKIYFALVEGNLKSDSGVINQPIGRSERDRKLMAIVKGGREAISQYEVVEKFKDNALVKVRILTGRTHQIRVHLKHLGHPVVGDKAYGFKKQKFNLDGQLLHAYSLTFLHPRSGNKMTITAPLPQYFTKVLNVLRNERQMEIESKSNN